MEMNMEKSLKTIAKQLNEHSQGHYNKHYPINKALYRQKG